MTPNRRMAAVIVLVPAAIALALWAFVWPNARLEPRDLPLGVAGPAQATAPVKAQLAERGGAFDVHSYAGESAARTAIEEREVYGAIVVTKQGPELLTASAASPTVAQTLTAAIGEQAAGEGQQVRTEDVVALPEDDPRGSALNSSVLPLALSAVGIGAAVTMLGVRGSRAVAAVAGASAAIGLIATGIAHSWLGALTGDWWTEAGVIGLTVLAGGAGVAGIAALLGARGVGLGALLVVMFGNPFSGVTSAPEMLPEPVGAIGQWLPPGAGGSLLRSVSYFDGNGAGGPVLTLGIWALAGLALVWLGALQQRRGAAADPQPATELRPRASAVA